MKRSVKYIVVLVLPVVFSSLRAGAGSSGTNGPATNTVPSRSMLTMGGIVTNPERKASPHFTGTSLPRPPRQQERWTPPESKLPTNYISATRVLFDQGLADPRGLEYRELEVGTGDVWQGDGGVVSVHGWVLPAGGKQRFAVCWNGLVYPVVALGTNADLETDVENLVTKGVATWRTVIPEGMAVSQTSFLGVKGCLLLRLGRVDLATRYWQAQIGRGGAYQNALFAPERAGEEVKIPDSDPYLTWATEWAWAMFDRMICAHERGDEALALVTARQLAEARPKIEMEAAKRGFPRPPDYNSPRSGKEQPYVGFLGQLPQILADLERRAKEGARVSVVERGLPTITNQSARIAALIHDLDLVQARQWGQPGSVNLAGDPIVSALIQEGDQAVEPLLDCVETDRRLTRSVGFGRDFHMDRTVRTVESAAMVALQSILQAGFPGGSKEMRAYWNKYKGLNLDERCYAILQDDAEGGRWLEAAAHITQPENEATFPGGFSTTGPAPTNGPARLRGEILRSKANPSVAGLLARRALELPTNNPNAYNLEQACRLGLHLAAWDPQAAEPVARTLVNRCCTVMKYYGGEFGPFVAKLLPVAARTGDTRAFEDYAAWLTNTVPEKLGNSLADCLEPLLKYTTNAILQSAAARLFGDTNSPWSRLPWTRIGFYDPVASDLVNVPAFRQLLARELDRKDVCGSIVMRESNTIGFTVTNVLNVGGTRGITLPANVQPAVGTAAEIRWCDWIALTLASTKRIPPFNPFVAFEQRDEAIERAKELLRGH